MIVFCKLKIIENCLKKKKKKERRENKPQGTNKDSDNTQHKAGSEMVRYNRIAWTD